MTRKPKAPKIYKVDFESLERRAGNYGALNSFEKAIIDKMASMSGSTESQLSPHQLLALDRVYEAFDQLTLKQQKVINMTFGLGDEEPMTELQIAEQLKISQPAVHKLKTRAIESIQKAVKAPETPEK